MIFRNPQSSIMLNGRPFVVTNSMQAFVTASPVMFALTPALLSTLCESFVCFISLPVPSRENLLTARPLQRFSAQRLLRGWGLAFCMVIPLHVTFKVSSVLSR